jgi:3-phenylpropionate/trans-cinnamate dioxygenase ferredoxin reductase subunit
MTGEGVVIVGAGQAAAQLALSLRQGGFAGSICMIGDEPYPPYQRPPLSKKFLSERGSEESLLLRPPSFWKEQGVHLVLGAGVGKLDLRQHRVLLREGRVLDYETLVHAGARARVAGGAARQRIFVAKD